MSYFEELMEKKSNVDIDSIFKDNLDAQIDSELVESLFTSIQNLSFYCWNKRFTRKRIEDWLANFAGKVFTLDKEKRIALFMLLHFVYYNLEEVKHLCKELFCNYLHEVYDSHIQDINKNSIEIMNNTYLFPLGNPSESGSNILYYFRTENKIPAEKFQFDLSEALFSQQYKGKNIIIMDDVTLTGEQAVRYIKRIINSHKNKKEGIFSRIVKLYKKDISKPISDRKIFILLLIADKEAIKNINNELKDFVEVTVITSIDIDKRSKVFSENSYVFCGNSVYNEECKQFASYYGQKIQNNNNKLGFNNSQLLMGFFYNIPDNTLPIFWVNDNWHAIFERADKVYGNSYKGVLENDRTIKYV